jgi:hypothetical protein
MSHRVKKLITIIAATSFLGACADTHQLIRNNTSATVRLTPSDAVVIALPEDGVYGTDIYDGSGQNTAQIIFSAFAKHTHSVKISPSKQNFEEALEATRKAGNKYLVYPIILHWEDRATEWSGISDKVEVKVEVIDATSGDIVTSGIVKGESGLATMGGDHPQDLLPEPIDEFVSSLY